MADETKGHATGTEEQQPFLDFKYLYTSWVGRFKIGEFFSSLLTGALVPGTVYKHGSGFSFISFVAWTTFINVVIDIILHLVRVWEKLIFIHSYPQVMVCLCFLGSVSLLVASLLEIGISQYAEHPALGYASAIFGFMCCFLLAAECFIHYRSYREKQQQRATEMTTTAEHPVGVQDPNCY